jgi:hypothetical protein
MPKMVDPHNALVEFQQLFDAGLVSPTRCELHDELRVLLDDTLGVPRAIYAFIKKRKVRALVIIAQVQAIGNVRTYGIAYAVRTKSRGKGLATSVTEKSIEEFSAGVFAGDKKLKKFYLEAIVGKKNAASRKVARRVVSKKPKSTTDHLSGEPAFAYVRLIERD